MKTNIPNSSVVLITGALTGIQRQHRESASTMGSSACLALYIDASGAALKARLIAGAPLKRARTPEQIAQTIVFLAHADASTPLAFHAEEACPSAYKVFFMRATEVYSRRH